MRQHSSDYVPVTNERLKEIYPTGDWQDRFYQALYGGM